MDLQRPLSRLQAAITTERMLRAFGVQIANVQQGYGASVYPTSCLRPPTCVRIPNDISSAAFFVVAALLVPGSQLCIEHIGVNSTRTGLLDTFDTNGRAGRPREFVRRIGEPSPI